MTRFENASWPLRLIGLSVIVLASAAVLAAVASLIALAGLRRLAADLSWASMPVWFWYFRGDPDVRRWLAIGLLSGLGLMALAALILMRGARPPLHGAARWAREGELRRAGLRAKCGIVVGRHMGRLLVFGGAEHVLVSAPTRSGKGAGIVIPNLLTWPHSVVVLDVKRENWTATAGFRAGIGQQVLVFDPLDAGRRTARFNPLGHIDRRDETAVIDELQKLAVMLFPVRDNTDPFWAEAARTGWIGVGAYVAATPALGFNFGAIYAELTRGDPRSRLAQVLIDRQDDALALSPACVSALSDFCSASDNTFASIKQTITARLNLWLNPHVCAATEVSDFDLRDLREKRISLYLTVSPDNLARIAPLYGLLMQQLVDLNTRVLPSKGRHDVPVLVILDEFARLGHVAVLAHAFSYVAGYGLRLLPVIQSPAQLRAEYGPDLAEDITSNCGLEVTFAPKDLRTAQDLSARLGAWTYPGVSQSRPQGLGPGHRTISQSDQRRALRLPQELMQMASDELIALRANLPPIRGRKIAYWREATFMRRVQPPPAPLGRPEPAVGSSTASGAPRCAGEGGGVQQGRSTAASHAPPTSRRAMSPLTPQTSEAELEAWVDRYIDREMASTPAGGRDA